MPTFIHIATGRLVTVDGAKAGKYDRLTSWERSGREPAPGPAQNADPVRVDPAGQIIEPPPKAGPGSSRGAWADYTALVKVEVADDATRDDIIAAVEAG